MRLQTRVAVPYRQSLNNFSQEGEMAEGNTLSEKALGRRRAVPVLYVQGSHYDIGFDTGRTFSSIIKNFVKEYSNLRDFEREYKTKRGWTAYEQTLANMKRRFPYYVKEIQGIADGSGVSFHQVRTPTQSTYLYKETNFHVIRWPLFKTYLQYNIYFSNIKIICLV
ncbi:uncharacterized protein LOC113226677 [Hyposmocoma kahamanoa]|uniref:uncharacterized protein LOC113226677 n=1 Tax=Hyposmocoma kahamanoa TaxID=1477025 RepID=UPI000E6D6190|nr:uncharacterized protein LOC113226677 [Hyposmocoma kahamanoa]